MAAAQFGSRFSGKGDSDLDARAGRPRGREALTDEAMEVTASLLRVIADPVRIALLEALSGGEAAVCDLGDRVGLPHKNASRHLLVLHQAGILSRRREGKLALYAVADWSAWWVIEQLGRSVESGSGDEA